MSFKKLDRDKTELTINLSDIHVPFQDEYAIELVLKILELTQPENIIILGDTIDLAAISTFPHNPEKAEKRLQDELDVAASLLRDIRDAVGKKAKMIFMEGNHEDRLRRYLMKNHEISSLRALKINELLELKNIGVNRYIEYSPSEWEWEPTEIGEHWIVPDRLVVIHGYIVRKIPGSVCNAYLGDYGVSVISGHNHKTAAVLRPMRRGSIIGVEQGCLSKRFPGYGRSQMSNWSQSFTMVHRVRGHKTFHIDLIPILADGNDYKCFVMGRRIGRKGYLD